jgi:hypothetical protein
MMTTSEILAHFKSDTLFKNLLYRIEIGDQSYIYKVSKYSYNGVVLRIEFGRYINLNILTTKEEEFLLVTNVAAERKRKIGLV